MSRVAAPALRPRRRGVLAATERGPLRALSEPVEPVAHTEGTP